MKGEGVSQDAAVGKCEGMYTFYSKKKASEQGWGVYEGELLDLNIDLKDEDKNDSTNHKKDGTKNENYFDKGKKR